MNLIIICILTLTGNNLLLISIYALPNSVQWKWWLLWSLLCNLHSKEKVANSNSQNFLLLHWTLVSSQHYKKYKNLAVKLHSQTWCKNNKQNITCGKYFNTNSTWYNYGTSNSSATIQPLKYSKICIKMAWNMELMSISKHWQYLKVYL